MIFKFNKTHILVLLISFICISSVSADTGVEISPHVIDEKAKANDMFKYEIKLVNNKGRKAGLYAVVNDITANGGLQEFNGPGRLDKKTSLARWISISRGVVNIEDGEEAVIPLEIKVDMNAAVGKYFASVAFVQASNRYDAEEYVKTQRHPQVLISFDIVEDITEKAQIKNFSPEKNFFVKPPYILNLEIENTGNRNVSPAGRVLIYDRRGSEVGEMPIEAGEIEPGQTISIAKEWHGEAMGKYKARIMLEYGKAVKKDLNDTLYFWVFPYKWLIGIFGAALLLLVSLVFIIFKRTYKPVHNIIPTAPTKKEENIKLVKKKNAKIKPSKSKIKAKSEIKK
jgi:hypothetical protein